jgi:hypothetical protein
MAGELRLGPDIRSASSVAVVTFIRTDTPFTCELYKNSGTFVGWKTICPAMLHIPYFDINLFGKFKIILVLMMFTTSVWSVICLSTIVPQQFRDLHNMGPVLELVCQTNDRPQVVEFLPDDGAPLVAPLSGGLPFGSVLSLEGTTPPEAQEWVTTVSSSSYICHGVGPLVDPFLSHTSRSLFKGPTMIPSASWGIVFNYPG